MGGGRSGGVVGGGAEGVGGGWAGGVKEWVIFDAVVEGGFVKYADSLLGLGGGWMGQKWLMGRGGAHVYQRV